MHTHPHLAPGAVYPIRSMPSPRSQTPFIQTTQTTLNLATPQTPKRRNMRTSHTLSEKGEPFVLPNVVNLITTSRDSFSPYPTSAELHVARFRLSYKLFSQMAPHRHDDDLRGGGGWGEDNSKDRIRCSGYTVSDNSVRYVLPADACFTEAGKAKFWLRKLGTKFRVNKRTDVCVRFLAPLASMKHVSAWLFGGWGKGAV